MSLPTTVPTTLPAFARMFATDEACRAYLFQVRWPDGFVCPKCGSHRAWPRRDNRILMECGNGHLTSVTAGTVLHGTKMPLTMWFYGAYLMTTMNPGISALQFAKQLGIKRYETAFQMLHKLRAALVAPDREPLKGQVEVDEQFIGGKEEGRPGRGAETKALVVCAVEVVWWFDQSGKKGRGGHEGHTLLEGPPEELAATKEGEEGVWRRRAGRVRMSVIPDASGDVLLPWVSKNIAPGSTVLTDGWSGYNGVTKLGYGHGIVYQRRGGIDTDEYLPLVHLIISNVKRWWLGTHKGAVLKHHLPAYLNEYTYRFNRRFWRGPAFLHALGLATHATKWPEYETLYDVKIEGAFAHPNPKLTHISDDLVAAVLDNLWMLAPSEELRRWMEANRQQMHVVTKEALANG